jgi:beta-N-acetylhexosaminidase
MKKHALTSIMLLVFIINFRIDAQSLKEKIGQMIWTSFTGTKLHDTIKVDLQQRNLGGVILFAANITSPTQVKKLNDTIKLFSRTPPFIAVDQEGGRVARLSRNNGFDTSYTAYTLGAIFNKEDSTRKMAGIMAGWVKQSGFNVNLAPVVDVNVNVLSPAIGKLERSYSKRPDTVYRHASWFINEFNKKNIITCLKHFPGHGSALQDSHLGFTDITNTWADSELVPYQLLFANGFADFVMPGHLYNAHLDSVYPASLSKKTATILLRNQLGFNGLSVTDAMSMQAITNNYTFEDAIEYAINAGNDILLYTAVLRNGSSLTQQVINIIEQKISQGKIPLSRIEESYNRIIQLKSKYGLINSTNEFAKTNTPTGFELYQNYPNPFNPNTKILYSLNVKQDVSLKVYDVLGNEIATLVNDNKQAGSYEVEFNASMFSSGIYYYQLRVGSVLITKKMVKLS